MKRLILILAILAVPAYAQFTPPANLGYCYYAAGGEWIPIASSGSSIGFTPPAISLYGLNGTTPAKLNCDANGNLIVSAAGSNTQVQFNNAGALGANSGLTYDASSNLNVIGSSSEVSLESNGAILQNMGATAAEQVQWGDRVGIGIPVPYVLATGTASPIAFDIAPTPGAANFTANTGVAWIDICDAAFANACSVTGNSNYESLRMGIMSNGTVHIESGQGGTGAAHPLCLQCTNSGGNAGVTIGGPLSTITSSAPLAVFASANPYINLGSNGGSNQAYWAVATTTGFLFSNTVAGDMGIRNNNGNIYLGANSGTSNPANMEILSTGLQTDFFGPAVSTNANNTVYSTTAAPNGSSAGVYFMGENTSPTTGANACIYLSSLNTTYNSFFYLCNVSTSTNYVGNITILARSGSATYAEQAKMLESATVDGATWVTGNYTATVAAATVSSGQISYGGTTAAVSNCGSLATATACVVINVAGTAHYIPYY